MSQTDLGRKYYIDNSFVEHGCCWGAAIVQKCEKGEGMYGGDVELVCECDPELAEMIRDALNAFSPTESGGDNES